MAFTLYIKADFFYSDYVPEVCLFSGRTDKLTLVEYGISIPREAEPDEARILLLQLLLPLLGIFLMSSNSDRVSLPIPAAAGAYGRWQWLRNGWWLGLLPLVSAPCMAPLAVNFVGNTPKALMWMGATGGLLLLMTIAAFLAGRLITPSIKVIGRKDLRLKFPASMKATYDAYLDGFFDYSQNQELNRKRVRTQWNKHLKYTDEEDGEAAQMNTDESDGNTPVEDDTASAEESEVPSPEETEADEPREDAAADRPQENPSQDDHNRSH